MRLIPLEFYYNPSEQDRLEDIRKRYTVWINPEYIESISYNTSPRAPYSRDRKCHDDQTIMVTVADGGEEPATYISYYHPGGIDDFIANLHVAASKPIILRTDA